MRRFLLPFHRYSIVCVSQNSIPHHAAMKHKITSSQSAQTYLFVISSLMVILFYAWLASSGAGGNGGVTSYYYSYLAEAFLDGNLYLAWQPDPRLLDIDNPYDPLARRELEKLSIITPVDFSL